jgi:hypothetical protein
MEFADSALAMGRETGMLEGFQKSLDVVKSISKALEAPEMPQPPQGIDPTTMPAATDTTPHEDGELPGRVHGRPWFDAAVRPHGDGRHASNGSDPGDAAPHGVPGPASDGDGPVPSDGHTRAALFPFRVWGPRLRWVVWIPA